MTRKGLNEGQASNTHTRWHVMRYLIFSFSWTMYSKWTRGLIGFALLRSNSTRVEITGLPCTQPLNKPIPHCLFYKISTYIEKIMFHSIKTVLTCPQVSFPARSLSSNLGRETCAVRFCTDSARKMDKTQKPSTEENKQGWVQINFIGIYACMYVYFVG